MTRIVITRDRLRPDFRASYHADLLDHWIELATPGHNPLSSSFRPQQFGGSLASMLMLHLDRGTSVCSGRIIGEKVETFLRLKSSRDDLFSHPIQKTGMLLKEILGWPEPELSPVYMEGTAPREQLSDIGFSALILPFRKASDSLEDDIFLVSFQFDDHLLKSSGNSSRFGLPETAATGSEGLQFCPLPGNYRI